MPSKKVKDSERRRCARACESCKRRKERCNGLRPCRRCLQRGVESRCQFAATSMGSPGRQGQVSPSVSAPGRDAPADGSPSIEGFIELQVPARQGAHGWRASTSSASPLPPGEPASPVAQVSRLLRDGRGELIFLGDAANLSFLQIIRRLARDALGPCSFVDDPLRHHLVEAVPETRTRWIASALANPASKPGLENANYLLNWYLLGTNCVLNLFDPSELSDHMAAWIQAPAPAADDDDDGSGCVLYLVLAIGAQSCNEERDELAERYFNWGRYLATSGFAEEPSIATVRTYLLITMYLLGTARRNSAFMYLGLAVRAAYALGIHRNVVAPYFSAEQVTTRARVWTAVRVLDTFMSISLGRPPATTSAASDAMPPAEAHYSAANDLCSIYGSILTDVYAKRMLIPEDMERISERHRRWSAKFSVGIATDNIQPQEYVTGHDGTKQLNIGLCHLKQSYYCSIMLLSRPFLVESVAKHISRMQSAGAGEHHHEPSPPSPREQVLVDACVDSAIRTIDLLQSLVYETVPKRLPFVVNSVFVAALVLGLAMFCDLEDSFPLGTSLALALKLLRKFGTHDAVARRDAAIVESLHAACALYCEQRARRKMEHRRLLVGSLFGGVHDHAERGSSAPQGREGHAAAGPLLSGRQTRQSTSHPIVQLGAAAGEDDGDRATERDLQTGSVSADTQTLCTEGTTLNGGMGGMPNFGNMVNGVLPMSPRAFFFDSSDEFVLLYPTVDARFIQLQQEGGEGMVPDDVLLGGVV
ncbi:C6 transcription factor [Tolypocladium paradoxum]|uniref:C6 transcription factor n=1 Tax=Tolypocladium paradoxum TaxID=94208 RepID=A0A2S4KW02_9HYPO|nr:C6 transcription factor [Tolypocladium paradoxum]